MSAVLELLGAGGEVVATVVLTQEQEAQLRDTHRLDERIVVPPINYTGAISRYRLRGVFPGRDPEGAFGYPLAVRQGDHVRLDCLLVVECTA